MKTALLKTVLTAALGLAAFTNTAQAADIKWKLTHFAPKTSAFYTVMTEPFLARMKDFLGDKIEITPYGGGELAPGFKAYDAVKDGIAEMAHTTPLYIVNKDFANTFLAGHPGGLDADGMLYWLYEAGGQKLATEFKRKTMGLHSLVVACVTAEIWHSHKKIQNVADLKGLRFRATGAWAAILKDNFGAAPVTVPGSEIYTLFERKGVDAMEWSGISENMKMGFDKIGKYITVPAPHLNSGCFEASWKVETWDALPKDVRTKIESIAKLATLDSLLIWKKGEIKALAKLSANKKNEVSQASAELRKAISDAGRAYVYKKVKEDKSPDGWLKKLADSYYGAMDEYDAAIDLIIK